MKSSLLLVIIFGCFSFARAQNYDEPASAGTSGTDNTAIGTNAGSNGSFNTSMGKAAGDVVTGSYNSFYGMNSGRVVSSGGHNTFTGYASGYSTTTGLANVFNGKDAGYSNITGNYNTYLGYKAGLSNTASNNAFIGSGSGLNSTGGNNTFVGCNAGYDNTSGVGNVFVGFSAGFSEAGSNKLYIDNSNTGTPLIYGDFSTNQVGLNTLPGSFTLNVGGPINATGLYVNGTAVSLGVTAVSPWTLDGTNVNYNNGNVGIGILSNNPAYKLDVNGTVNATGFLLNGAPLSTSQWATSGSIIYYTGGNVGIGTTSTGSFKLAVEGKIGAREVQVTTTSPWPDYVFEPDYNLLSISEVEKFIKDHGHLPEVPSADKIKSDGHKLGEMNVILLQKVEEMMLYIIQQEKKINSLEAQISILTKK